MSLTLLLVLSQHNLLVILDSKSDLTIINYICYHIYNILSCIILVLPNFNPCLRHCDSTQLNSQCIFSDSFFDL